MFNMETILNFLMIILGKNFWKLCLENINANSNGLAKFLQICMNTLDQMAPRKKNTYVAITCFFLIKNYLVHTKKEATKKSLSQKRSNQNKRRYTKQRNFCVSVLLKTKKSTMPI